MKKEKNYNEPEKENENEKTELFKEDKAYDENELCKAGKLYEEGEVYEEDKEVKDDEEVFAVIDALIELIKKQPVPPLKYPNIVKYQGMMRSAEKLQALLKDECVNVKITPEFNIGSISVELPELSIDLTHEFADIIVGADNLEIYPLINGNIRLDFTFQSVLKSYYGDEKK